VSFSERRSDWISRLFCFRSYAEMFYELRATGCGATAICLIRLTFSLRTLLRSYRESLLSGRAALTSLPWSVPCLRSMQYSAKVFFEGDYYILLWNMLFNDTRLGTFVIAPIATDLLRSTNALFFVLLVYSLKWLYFCTGSKLGSKISEKSCLILDTDYL